MSGHAARPMWKYALTDDQHLKLKLMQEHCLKTGLSLAKLLASETRPGSRMTTGEAVDRLYKRIEEDER